MNYQEYKQSLNQKLTERVQKELSSFQEEMLSKSTQEIYGAAKQIAVKNEIVKCFSDKDFSPQAVKALLKSPNLLHEIYEEWFYRNYSHMEDLHQTITEFKDYMVKTEKILSGMER